jgi:four helix bundle protein
MRDYKQILAWQRAHALVLSVYHATDHKQRCGPPGLVGQIRRAVMAIPTNIAEGCGHNSPREFARFLAISCASAVELEYLLQLARDLDVIEPNAYASTTSETIAVRRMCHALRSKLL